MELYVHPYHPTHLFTLRLWQEELSIGEMEWRLQLRSVETGRTHYFRDWPSLISLLLVMTSGDGNENPTGAATEQTTDDGKEGRKQ